MKREFKYHAGTLFCECEGEYILNVFELCVKNMINSGFGS
jgi:hypothetical protein